MLKQLVKESLHHTGWAIHRVPRPRHVVEPFTPEQDRIHYACGYNYLPHWLNADILRSGPANYVYVNLVQQHPFPDNHFRLAFCEDFIEHIDQADSLVFLAEVHRTLRPGGVLRVTFPCLDGVLQHHYRAPGFKTYAAARAEVFSELGHVHYYSRESFRLVAQHIGFDVQFVEAGHSQYEELRGLNSRLHAVNLHAELTKQAR